MLSYTLVIPLNLWLQTDRAYSGGLCYDKENILIKWEFSFHNFIQNSSCSDSIWKDTITTIIPGNDLISSDSLQWFIGWFKHEIFQNHIFLVIVLKHFKLSLLIVPFTSGNAYYCLQLLFQSSTVENSKLSPYQPTRPS